MPSSLRTVLVVEDDCLLLLNARLLLENAGYRVLDAPNAETALALLDANPDVTSMFTDIAMPGAMDGIALAAEVGRRRPGLPVFITSGTTSMADAAISPSATFLPKPYTAAAMLRLLAA